MLLLLLLRRNEANRSAAAVTNRGKIVETREVKGVEICVKVRCVSMWWVFACFEVVPYECVCACVYL